MSSLFNATDEPFSLAIRGSLAGLTLLILVTSAAANIVIIIAFARFEKLRTNFNFYLLNLSVSDLLLALFSMSNFAIFSFFGYYPFGDMPCTLWLYCDWLFSSATETCMMLVSLDRVVSIYWPIWYRNRQSSKHSLVILLLMWIWLNSIIIPSLLLTRRHDNPEVTSGHGMCLIDYAVYQDWITVSVILLFWLPEAVTIISYVFIAIRVRKNFGKHHRGLVNVKIVKQGHTLPNHDGGVDEDRVSGENSLDETSMLSDKPTTKAIEVNGNGTKSQPPPEKTHKSREQKERKTFRLLSYLVIAVLICCVPADVYHFINATRPQWASYGFYLVSSFLTFLHCILNPILYHAGLDDMKKAIHSLFSGRCTA